MSELHVRVIGLVQGVGFRWFVRERARRFVTASGVADGDARIRVGSTLSIGGLGPLFNGKYYVASVRHSYDGQYGFRTAFELERPGLGASA